MSTTLFAGDSASLFAEMAEVSSDPVGSYTIDLTSAAITNTSSAGWSVLLAAGSSLTVAGVAAGSTISEPSHATISQAVYAGNVTFSNISFDGSATIGGGGGGTGGVSGHGSTATSYGALGAGSVAGDSFGGGVGSAAYTFVEAGKTFASAGGGGGGGGLGAGGAVFVRHGGRLVFTSGTITRTNYAFGGQPNANGIPFYTNTQPPTAGAGFGGGIFMQGNTTVTLDPGAGQTVSIAGVIADEFGSQERIGMAIAPSSGLLVAGSGTVSLTGTNTFAGGLRLRSSGGRRCVIIMSRRMRMT